MSTTRHVVTILAVSDLERSVRFYERAFGWPTRIDAPPVFREFDLGSGAGLGVYQREAFGRNTGEIPPETPAGAISSTEVYFHCDDLDEAIGRLEAAGARLLSPRAARDWGDEAAYYADPDGNVVVVAKPAG